MRSLILTNFSKLEDPKGSRLGSIKFEDSEETPHSKLVEPNDSKKSHTIINDSRNSEEFLT